MVLKAGIEKLLEVAVVEGYHDARQERSLAGIFLKFLQLTITACEILSQMSNSISFPNGR